MNCSISSTTTASFWAWNFYLYVSNEKGETDWKPKRKNFLHRRLETIHYKHSLFMYVWWGTQKRHRVPHYVKHGCRADTSPRAPVLFWVLPPPCHPLPRDPFFCFLTSPALGRRTSQSKGSRCGPTKTVLHPFLLKVIIQMAHNAHGVWCLPIPTDRDEQPFGLWWLVFSCNSLCFIFNSCCSNY